MRIRRAPLAAACLLALLCLLPALLRREDTQRPLSPTPFGEDTVDSCFLCGYAPDGADLAVFDLSRLSVDDIRLRQRRPDGQTSDRALYAEQQFGGGEDGGTRFSYWINADDYGALQGELIPGKLTPDWVGLGQVFCPTCLAAMRAAAGEGDVVLADFGRRALYSLCIPGVRFLCGPYLVETRTLRAGGHSVSITYREIGK